MEREEKNLVTIRNETFFKRHDFQIERLIFLCPVRLRYLTNESTPQQSNSLHKIYKFATDLRVFVYVRKIGKLFYCRVFYLYVCVGGLFLIFFWFFGSSVYFRRFLKSN